MRDASQPAVATALPRSYGTRNSSLALISFREAGLAGVGAQVAYSCNPYGEPLLQLYANRPGRGRAAALARAGGRGDASDECHRAAAAGDCRCATRDSN